MLSSAQYGCFQAQQPSFLPLQKQAENLKEGHVFVIDGRAVELEKGVPPEDILGFFKVQDETVLTHTYEQNPNHQLYSNRGFFLLSSELREPFVEALKERSRLEHPKQ